MPDTKHPAEVSAEWLECMRFGRTKSEGDKDRSAAAQLRRIPALEAERDHHRQWADALATELKSVQELIKKWGVAAAVAEAERDQLRAEVEALRADAERYRHLTTSMGPRTTLCYDGKECIGKAEFDALIDAARKQQ